ncbi:MAG: hypothetical protein WAT93_00420 [Pontixanthobacter sp.]
MFETLFILFLKAFVAGEVYYDPAMKVVGAAPNVQTKKRSQFRIKHRQLTELYHNSEVVDLTIL